MCDWKLVRWNLLQVTMRNADSPHSEGCWEGLATSRLEVIFFPFNNFGGNYLYFFLLSFVVLFNLGQPVPGRDTEAIAMRFPHISARKKAP